MRDRYRYGTEPIGSRRGSSRSRKRRRRRPHQSAGYIGIPVLLGVLCWIGVSARGGGNSALASLPAGHLRTFAYTVVPGDALQTLAVAFGTTPTTLQSVNRLPPDAAPRVGQRLLIPRPSHGYQVDGSFPSGTRHLIEVTARRFHVDLALALAVAWQESRAQQQAVSDRQAVGIMQVEPATGEQVAAQLGCPIDLSNAYDNVIAGVYWLGHLLQYYHGDVQQAVAAYNEGQTNFARYGYLPDARQYMQNVLRFQMALSAP